MKHFSESNVSELTFATFDHSIIVQYRQANPQISLNILSLSFSKTNFFSISKCFILLIINGNQKPLDFF